MDTKEFGLDVYNNADDEFEEKFEEDLESTENKFD